MGTNPNNYCGVENTGDLTTSLMQRINALEAKPSFIYRSFNTVVIKAQEGDVDGLAVSPYSGDVYISGGSNGVIRYDSNGVFLDSDTIVTANSIAVFGDDYLYTQDGLGSLAKVAYRGSVLSLQNMSFTGWLDLSIAPNTERISITIPLGPIHIRDSNGASLFSILGNFYSACMDSDDNIYAATTIDTVEVYSPSGAFIRSHGFRAVDINYDLTTNSLVFGNGSTIIRSTLDFVVIESFTATMASVGNVGYYPVTGQYYWNPVSPKRREFKIATPVDTVIQKATQTTFKAYPTATDAGVSFGAPDGGVLIPSLGGLDPTPGGQVYEFFDQYLTDMRIAIKNVAPFYKNVITGNPFNWAPADPDNLYNVAVGDRTKYGATGGAQYDWTTGTSPGGLFDIHFGEIDDCLTLLENSSRV